MAVAEVQKINIIAHQDFKKQILELLYDRGFIEIISLANEGKERGTVDKVAQINIEYELAKVKYAREFLAPYFFKKESFIQKINAEKPKIGFTEIQKLKSEFNYIKVAEQAENLSQKLNSLKSLVSKLEEERKILKTWENLKLLTESDIETVNTKVILGNIEKKKYDELRKAIEEKFTEIEIVEVNEDDVVFYIFLVFTKEYEKDLSQLLSVKEFKITELPLLNVTARERITQINRELQKVVNEIKAINDQAQQLSQDNLQNLQIIFDFLTWQFQQEQIQENFIFTKSSFSVLGWIKKAELPTLKEKLKKITNSVEIVPLKIDKNEPVPIATENPKFLKPFEFVTNIYGFPKYNEVDPTPFLAGFFILFFALCLTDAGYGLALMVSTFLALKYLKVSSEFKKLLKVLFYGGIITFIAGGLTGGWFGIVLEELPIGLSWLAQPLIAIRQIDPIKDPITILIISLILGYIHLVFGNAINLWWKIKHGEIKTGLIDSGVWMYFLLTIGFWLVASLGIVFAGLAKIAPYLVYSAIVLVILTQGKSKNPIMKILGGLAGLYFGITGYISDILSYSRLLALGLATSIIGMVINIIGTMVNEMIPYVGWLLMIFVLIGGHIFNLIISLVGAFIHSGRLQYVEFFKTFFEGGGRQFSPFVRKSKYVELIKK